MRERDIFIEAHEMSDPSERAALLDDACQGDATLRRQVEQLLAEHERRESFFLDAPPAGLDATVDRSLSEGPGTVIGPYNLLEQIGEGGFGVVFLAEQEKPVRRRVALKVVKPGMDTREVIARFEAERQALALMDHPNIAKVYDAGESENGRPYFVMELVPGVPITEYCDQCQLATRERLELFITVCQAVQHAHQKGVIHRDLKPTNVLVALQDGKAAPKIIDFGIAKALSQRLTEQTLATGFAQMIGTPLYMSPEQAELSPLGADTRSDVYSLGVLLYELLTGTTPFDKERLHSAGYDELRRILREEEPPRPSARLSTLAADLATTVAEQRRTEPRRLAQQVRGELDWIVMTCLEKDRNRRFESAADLARDVERYLADEPVQACPPSANYRLRKFIRRNKATVVTASVIGIALLVAVGSFGWAMRDRTARHARLAGQIELVLSEVEQLQREQKWAEALLAARRAAAVVIGGEADEATAQRVGALLHDLEFIDRLEQIRMEKATWTGGKFDMAGADREYARAFGRYGVAVDKLPVERSIERLKARPLLAVPLAAALDDWADAHWQSKGDAASSNSQRLVAVARGIDPEPLRDRVRSTGIKPAQEAGDELARLAESIDMRAQLAGTLENLASKLRRVKRLDSAVRLLRKAQSVYPGDFWINFHLAHRLADQNDYEGAVRFYTAALSIRPSAVAVRQNLGMALEAQQKLDEAIAAHRGSIELDPEFAAAYNSLGVVLRRQGKLDEADAALRKAIELAPQSRDAHNNLGALLCDLQDYDQAVACYRRAIEVDPRFDSAYFNLGITLKHQGKVDEAIAAYRKVIELAPQHVNAHNNLGALLSNDLQDYDQAVACFRRAIELDPNFPRAYNNLGITLGRQKKLPEAVAAIRKAIELDPDFAPSYSDLGVALQNQGELDEAVAAFSKAIELDPQNAAVHNGLAWLLATCADAKLRDPSKALALATKAVELDPENSNYLNTLGAVYYRAGDWKAALSALEKSMVLSQGGNSDDWFFLAMTHWQLGNKDEARRWYDRAVTWMEKNAPANEELVRFRAEAAELLEIAEPQAPPDPRLQEN